MRNCKIYRYGFSLVAFLSVAATAAAVTPKQGGALVFARGSDSVSLDPGTETDGESLNIADNIFDTLVRFKNGTTEIEPALATSWSVSKDGLTYTFKLRPGVEFHDGTPVNAEAVVYSFMRQKDSKHPAYGWGGPYIYFTSLTFDKLLKEIKAVDNTTVTFVLVEQYAPFVSALALQSFGIVSPTAMAKYKKDFRFKPVGSGPFVFQSWEKNQKIVLAANKKYWDGAPYVDRVIVRAIPDNSTRLVEMMSGKVHIMDNPNPDDVKVLRSRGGNIAFAEMEGFNVAYLAMQNDKAPFNNVLVRQAVSHAINRAGIIKAIYAGNARPADNPMPPKLWGHNDKVKGYPYDIKKAKELLTKAGFPNGFSTTLWAMPVPRPYMPDGRKVAEAIQGDLAKIGITAKIVSYEWGTYLEKTNNGEHEMALMGWTGDIGDPDNFLFTLLDKNNAIPPAQNISFYKSEEVHKLLKSAQLNPDQAVRTKAYLQAQEIIHKDAPMVPIAHSVEVVPMQKNVQGFILDPTGRRRFAKVWLN